MFLKRVPPAVRIGTIVGTAAVVVWLFLHAREDPPRGDRGPVALPSVSATADAGDASADGAVVVDAP